jgi:hypothetical protein
MKKLIVVLAMVLLVVLIAWAIVTWAGEKEDLTLKYEALVARFNRAQQALPELATYQAAQQRMPEFKALQEFGQELDKKGYTIGTDGQVIERPKDAPRPAEPKPAPKAPAPVPKK